MLGRLVGCLIAAFAGLIAAATASAQDGATGVGYVAEIGGPTGSVIVVRGAESYVLAPGDLLFLGDRIVTRKHGTVKITVKGCQRSLEPTGSILVSLNVCTAVPVSLAGPPLDPAAEEATVSRAVAGPMVGPALAASTILAYASLATKATNLLSSGAPASATLGSHATID